MEDKKIQKIKTLKTFTIIALIYSVIISLGVIKDTNEIIMAFLIIIQIIVGIISRKLLYEVTSNKLS